MQSTAAVVASRLSHALCMSALGQQRTCALQESMPLWVNSGHSLRVTIPRSVRSWCVLSFVGEAIHHLLGSKSGDGKAADRLQAVVATVIDEILRSEDGSAQAAGKFLKPRRQIYRRADAGEIQPVAVARSD